MRTHGPHFYFGIIHFVHAWLSAQIYKTSIKAPLNKLLPVL